MTDMSSSDGQEQPRVNTEPNTTIGGCSGNTHVDVPIRKTVEDLIKGVLTLPKLFLMTDMSSSDGQEQPRVNTEPNTTLVMFSFIAS